MITNFNKMINIDNGDRTLEESLYYMHPLQIIHPNQ